MEPFLRELLDQGAESRNLDYKGPMAWEGGKPERAELIRDLICFSNTPSGGFIVIGVSEGAAGWIREGVTNEQAATFDPTAIGDLAANYCSVQPVFHIHRVLADNKLYVVIGVDEIGNQPIICLKDCRKNNKLLLRAGAIYTRTGDAKCSEIRSAEDMQRLLDLAIRNRGDALLAQIAGLFRGQGTVDIPPPDEEWFLKQQASAAEYFAGQGLQNQYWQVEIRPAEFAERLVASREDLVRARDDAVVALRGWNFPHVDREGGRNFGEGIQSLTRFVYHHEAHRVFFSGLFLWRSLIREDFEEERFRNTLIYESTIWSFVEIWLFASRYLSALVEGGNAVVEISIHGLQGRTLVPGGHQVSLSDVRPSEEDEFRQRVTLSLGDLRANYLERAARGTIDLFELFDATIPTTTIQSWQERLLNREF